VIDAWQGRRLGSALVARLSERALEAGIEYSPPKSDGVARSTAICLDEVIPAGRTPCSASPPTPGADPHDPRPALNSRRSLYNLRQWRDSHHLLFSDREPARWTSQ
jgi:hypothetical protein